MSKSTKRKHVTKEILDDYYEPNEDEQIVQIIAAKGNNLHEVKTVSNENFLVSMPNKYRKSVWVKRGDYVVIQTIKEGNKVQGEIVSILYPKQIKYLKQKNMWPEEFSKESVFDDAIQKNDTSLKIKEASDNSGEDSCSSNEDSDRSEDDDTLFKNPNHRVNHIYEDDEITSESENSACEEEYIDEGKNNNEHCYRVDNT